MQEPEKKPLNWWAGFIAFGMVFPIAWVSFDNVTSAIIMGGAAGAVGLFLFRTSKL